MNTERTEKFVNAIACDLEEGGFRQVSGTTLRRTLATAVSAALPLLADTGIPASQPAELAEQQAIADFLKERDDALGCPDATDAERAESARLIAALAARQPVHVQGSDELSARTDGERAAYLEGIEEGSAQAARQPGAQPCVCSSDEGATCTTHYGPGCLYGRADVEPRAAAVVDGFVIANGSGKKYMAWGQVGPEWVADRSAALWLVRRADAEALAAENEDAWLILPVERCALPPNGWACTLASGHKGPCPTIAAPPAQGIDLGQLPVVARLYERHTGRCTYRRASVTRAEGEPLVRLADVRALIDQRDAAPGVGNG